MSIAEQQQVLRCVGELKIDNGGTINKELRGALTFVDQGKNYAQLRVYAFSGMGELTLDCVNVTQGFNVRTNQNQGSSYMQGQGEPFAMQVLGEQTRLKALRVASTRTTLNPQYGTSLVDITRTSTEDSFQTTKLDYPISGCSQTKFKTGEGVFQYVGSSESTSFWMGYRAPTGLTSSSVNHGEFGINYNGTYTPCMKLYQNGNINIPAKLSVNTIEAVTYQNLPPFNPADIAPITLDDPRVGINNPTPVTTLDVVDPSPGVFLGKTIVGKFTKPDCSDGEKTGIQFGKNDTESAYLYYSTEANGELITISDPNQRRLTLNHQQSKVFSNFDVNGELSISSGAYWILSNIDNNGTQYQLLSNSALGPSILSSSLTSVGTLTSLSVEGNITQSSGATTVKALTADQVTSTTGLFNCTGTSIKLDTSLGKTFTPTVVFTPVAAANSFIIQNLTSLTLGTGVFMVNGFLDTRADTPVTLPDGIAWGIQESANGMSSYGGFRANSGFSKARKNKSQVVINNDGGRFFNDNMSIIVNNVGTTVVPSFTVYLNALHWTNGVSFTYNQAYLFATRIG
jgi:hypothetical protein